MMTVSRIGSATRCYDGRRVREESPDLFARI